MRITAADQEVAPLAVPSLRTAIRLGGTLARAGIHAVEGVGRARLSTRRLDPGATLRRRATELRDVFGRLCEAHRVEIDTSGELAIGPAVLVANHLSYLDPLVLGATAACAPIAKEDVARWPVIGGAARALGVLFVDRADPFSGMRVLREALRRLEAGVPVLCFPEGTTTGGDELLPFRRGLFGAARLAGVPIVPIGLRYEDPALCWVGDDDFLPHYLRTSARDRIVARVRIGSPIHACATRTADDLAAQARRTILHLLGSET